MISVCKVHLGAPNGTRGKDQGEEKGDEPLNIVSGGIKRKDKGKETVQTHRPARMLKKQRGSRKASLAHVWGENKEDRRGGKVRPVFRPKERSLIFARIPHRRR